MSSTSFLTRLDLSLPLPFTSCTQVSLFISSPFFNFQNLPSFSKDSCFQNSNSFHKKNLDLAPWIFKLHFLNKLSNHLKILLLLFVKTKKHLTSIKLFELFVAFLTTFSKNQNYQVLISILRIIGMQAWNSLEVLSNQKL